jgi:hypothetical protein
MWHIDPIKLSNEVIAPCDGMKGMRLGAEPQPPEAGFGGGTFPGAAPGTTGWAGLPFIAGTAEVIEDRGTGAV